MKKLISSTLFASLAILLFSCKKESAQLPGNANDAVENRQRTVNPKNGIQVSSWITMDFTLSSSTEMQAETVLKDVNFDVTQSTQLAIVKYPGRESYVYEVLPVELFTAAGTVSLSFNVTPRKFTVRAENINNVFVNTDTNMFDNYQFRYIVLPRSVVSLNAIDWTNYESIAKLLKIDF